MENFEDLLRLSQNKPTKNLAIIAPEEKSVIQAIFKGMELEIIKPILIGEEKKINEVLVEAGLKADKIKIIDAQTKEEAAGIGVELIQKGEADLLMKGLVDTSTVLRACLKHNGGIRGTGFLSHVGVIDHPEFNRLFIVTDAALNIAPDFEGKKAIIKNAANLSKSLGNSNPKVACICAKEKENPKMPDTVDAVKLQKFSGSTGFENVVISGPLALDNAVSEESAQIKKITDPVAGKADILFCGDIEGANILYKSFNFLTKSRSGGLVVGAEAPIVLTSRADSVETKLHSILLGALID